MALRKRNLDDAAVQSAFVVFLTVILHKLAGGLIPNLIIIFGLWVILTCLFFTISNKQITWQKTLIISMISQPVIHNFFHSEHFSQLVCAPNSHSNHLSINQTSCSDITTSTAHTNSSSINMVLAHVFAIIMIQICSKITAESLKVVYCEIKRTWFVVVRIFNFLIQINFNEIKHYIQQISSKLNYTFEVDLLRRGPPALLNS